MADQKVSEMTAAATLTGDELVPVVQGGANRQAAIGRLGGSFVFHSDRTEVTYFDENTDPQVLASFALPDFAGLWDGYVEVEFAVQQGSMPDLEFVFMVGDTEVCRVPSNHVDIAGTGLMVARHVIRLQPVTVAGANITVRGWLHVDAQMIACGTGEPTSMAYVFAPQSGVDGYIEVPSGAPVFQIIAQDSVGGAFHQGAFLYVRAIKQIPSGYEPA